MTHGYVEHVEEAYTQWYNPLTYEQRVDIHEMGRRPTRYRWAPGETKRLPSRYDYAIHTVHNGVIIGGLAPQLVKVGSNEKLDPALDPAASAKKAAEAAQVAAMLQKSAADQALLLATGALNDARIQGEHVEPAPEAPAKRSK